MNLFKRMIAFVMAYSFSEDQESPSMIPMADMLNHHSNNNAHLIFERNSLKMVSCKKIEKVVCRSGSCAWSTSLKEKLYLLILALTIFALS